MYFVNRYVDMVVYRWSCHIDEGTCSKGPCCAKSPSRPAKSSGLRHRPAVILHDFAPIQSDS